MGDLNSVGTKVPEVFRRFWVGGSWFGLVHIYTKNVIFWVGIEDVNSGMAWFRIECDLIGVGNGIFFLLLVGGALVRFGYLNILFYLSVQEAKKRLMDWI